MSSIIEATVVDSAGKSHGSFEVEFPEIADDWKSQGPDLSQGSRYVTEPFTNNVFRVTLSVGYVGESV